MLRVQVTSYHHITDYQRWSRGHKARGQGQGQGHKKNPRPRPRPRTAFPRTDTIEAKDWNARGQGQGPRTQSASALKKKKKKRSSQKFFKRSPRKNVFQKIFQPLHKILTFQKIVLSSSRGQANFRGLDASRPRPRPRTWPSRPRPRPRTSKSVLEDVLEAKDVLEDSTSADYLTILAKPCLFWRLRLEEQTRISKIDFRGISFCVCWIFL